MKTYPNPKINLGLNVLRKRSDGFHDLETLFIPYFGMTDILEIEPASGEKVQIHIIGPKVDWDPMKDLTVKAYNLLDAEFGLPPVKICLTKNIPVGAGLGGGSADAAFALRMLSDMFGLALDDDALAAYASRLGSDCAFFIYNRPMFGTGRGEVLTPYSMDLNGYDIRVEIPEGVAVSTAEAYKGVLDAKLRRLAGASDSPKPLEEILGLPVEQWKDLLSNDFEATVFPAHPEIPALKKRFYDEGAVYAAMSGSGSAVFGIFKK